MNTWNEYVEATRKTAVYPHEHRIAYPMLGIVGEIGELLDAPNEHLLDEIGDVFWYIAALKYDLGIHHGLALATFEVAQEGILRTDGPTPVAKDLLSFMSLIFPLCEAVKKYCRKPSEERFKKAAEKLDLLFVYLVKYTTLICKSTLREVCEANITKLRSRQEADTLT